MNLDCIDAELTKLIEAPKQLTLNKAFDAVCNGNKAPAKREKPWSNCVHFALRGPTSKRINELHGYLSKGVAECGGDPVASKDAAGVSGLLNQLYKIDNAPTKTATLDALNKWFKNSTSTKLEGRTKAEFIKHIEAMTEDQPNDYYSTILLCDFVDCAAIQDFKTKKWVKCKPGVFKESTEDSVLKGADAHYVMHVKGWEHFWGVASTNDKVARRIIRVGPYIFQPTVAGSDSYMRGAKIFGWLTLTPFAGL